MLVVSGKVVGLEEELKAWNVTLAFGEEVLKLMILNHKMGLKSECLV